MKRRDFLKKLEAHGWKYKRSGKSHDIYTNGKESEAVPRHTEMNDLLAEAIIKRRGLK